ncbi:hypothetical protein CAPN002_25860 [Capnocytophaga stomatis]|nr:hypothetical protein CAPN002_25860 [Capnocytophaga stomatis]
MRKALFLLTILSCISGLGQKKIKDPALLAQEKRMVFEKWGDWKPDPVYPKILGIRIGENISPHYAIAWGKWASPKRNRRYKNGPDIRPLRVGGEESNRMLAVHLMKKQTEHIQKSVDSIRRKAQAEMAHWTRFTVDADPLYVLYYRKMLEPLRKFPPNPKTYWAWGFENEKIFQEVQSSGQLSVLQEKLELIKDNYKKAKMLDMPRGKRFLLFHKTLIQWRDFLSLKNQINNNHSVALVYKEKRKLKVSEETLNRNKTDKEIVREIMQKYKHQF